MKKRLPTYEKFKRKVNLRDEIASALDRIAEEDFVEDIEPERLIVGHHKRPHVAILKYGGKALSVSIHAVDKYGRGIGCKAKILLKGSKEFASEKYHSFEKWLKDFVPSRPDPGYA